MEGIYYALIGLYSLPLGIIAYAGCRKTNQMRELISEIKSRKTLINLIE